MGICLLLAIFAFVLHGSCASKEQKEEIETTGQIPAESQKVQTVPETGSGEKKEGETALEAKSAQESTSTTAKTTGQTEEEESKLRDVSVRRGDGHVVLRGRVQEYGSGEHTFCLSVNEDYTELQDREHVKGQGFEFFSSSYVYNPEGLSEDLLDLYPDSVREPLRKELPRKQLVHVVPEPEKKSEATEQSITGSKVVKEEEKKKEKD